MGIRALNDSLAMKDLIFAGCAALSILSGRFGREYCKKKMLKKCVRSRYVYENKQISDKMPEKKSDIFVLRSDIFV
jgi:hypothetical protein